MGHRGANRQRKSSAPGPLLPLEYMLGIMRDETADPARRDRMAICAAQYCHPRAANHPKGKKIAAQEAAAEAGDGWGGDLEYLGGRLRQ